MLIPVKTGSAESTIKGSRFLGEAFVISNASEVKEIVKKQKEKYSLVFL